MTRRRDSVSRGAKRIGLGGLGFVIAIAATTLPERYRLKVTDVPESQLLGPASVSGLIQLMVCGSLYINIFLATRGSYPLFPMLEYAVDPKRIPLGYLTIEGAVRLLSAFASNEVLPSLPLVAIERIHGHFEERKEAERMGPRVRDRVTSGDGKACDWCV